MQYSIVNIDSAAGTHASHEMSHPIESDEIEPYLKRRPEILDDLSEEERERLKGEEDCKGMR